MAEQNSKSNPFVTMFVPGLVLGLLVGGLAGAFLPPIVERMGGPGTTSGGSSAPRNMQPVERDARPTPKPAPETKPPETKPAETKPTEAKPTEAKPGDPKPDETKPPEPKPGDPTPPNPETTPPAARRPSSALGAQHLGSLLNRPGPLRTLRPWSRTGWPTSSVNTQKPPAFLGVDFVPAYRRGDSGESPGAPIPADTPPTGGEVFFQTSAAETSTTAPSVVVETKPSPAPVGAAPKQARSTPSVPATKKTARTRTSSPPSTTSSSARATRTRGSSSSARPRAKRKTNRPPLRRARRTAPDQNDRRDGPSRASRSTSATSSKLRPLNNATPTSREIEICSPYLFEQVGIISPEAIVTLGLPAAKAVLRCEGTMGGLRALDHHAPRRRP